MSLDTIPLELLGMIIEHMDSKTVLNLTAVSHGLEAGIQFLRPIYIKKRLSLLRNERRRDKCTMHIDKLFMECAIRPSPFLLDQITDYLLDLSKVVQRFGNPAFHIAPLKKIVARIRKTAKKGAAPDISIITLMEFITTFIQESFYVDSDSELNDDFNDWIEEEHQNRLIRMWELLLPISIFETENPGQSIFSKGIGYVDDCHDYIIYVSHRFDEDRPLDYVGADEIYSFGDTILAMWGGRMGVILSKALENTDPESEGFEELWQNTAYLSGLLTVMTADLLLAVHASVIDLNRITRMLRGCPPLGIAIDGLAA